MLPITKTIGKEMLNIIDVPAIFFEVPNGQYVIDTLNFDTNKDEKINVFDNVTLKRALILDYQ